MLRMEIALVIIVAFVAFTYFTAEKERAPLHRVFSVLLAAVLANLILDGITVYTVNHLDAVPVLINDGLHRMFLGTMVLVIFLFYEYIAVLIQEETGRQRRMDIPAKFFLLAALLGNFLLPIKYMETEAGNYSAGAYMFVPYAAVAFYLVICAALLIASRRNLPGRQKTVIGVALAIEFIVSVLQGINHTWLISGMGITLMTMAFYLTLENPEALKSELREQKISMLYLKSQVNPHFLYNTLDTIRIQAQLNGDNKVAGLLMRLVDFFRLSIKVDDQMVSLDDEMEMIEAYLELMCARYPKLNTSFDVDPELGIMQVPNFILQPIVENSLLHGLKNKGYEGDIDISAQPCGDNIMEICIRDTGTGFSDEQRAAVEKMLHNPAGQSLKLTGSSVGIINVQKRIKMLCGREFGLSYIDNTHHAAC